VRGETGWATVFAAARSVLAPMASVRAGCDDQRVRHTVLVVDDHAGFRASARALLEAEGFTVVGEASDGLGAIAEVRRLGPDVVLLDIQLPDLDGIEVASRLASLPDPPAVVLISSRDASAYGPRLPAARALGFISKRNLSGAGLANVLG
jgi:DNA-binding NarL/FixJ family response regulator